MGPVTPPQNCVVTIRGNVCKTVNMWEMKHIVFSNTTILGNSILEHCQQQGVQSFGISEPHWKKSCFGLYIKYINTNGNW